MCSSPITSGESRAAYHNGAMDVDHGAQPVRSTRCRSAGPACDTTTEQA